MEAKDTVINLGKTDNESLKIMMEKILLHQAELAFKAGMEEEAKGGTNSLSYLKGVEDGERRGRKEVAKWIEANRETPLGKDAYGYYIWEGSLHSKKEEWGL